MKKTLVFLLLVVPLMAVKLHFVNKSSNGEAFYATDGTSEFSWYLPAYTASTTEVHLASPLTYSLQGYSGQVTYEWKDDVQWVVHGPDDAEAFVIPGWSWFDVAELAFWGFCAYYAAKLALYAVRSLWKMPEP